MKLAVDTFSYYMHFGKHWYIPQKPVDLRWYCETSKNLNLDGLHIDPYHINFNTDLDWIADFALKNEMYVELGACGTAIKDLEPYINAAKKLRAGILRTFVGGSCLDDRTEISERIKKAKKELMKSVLLAEKQGIKIAVENHGDIFIEDMLSLMEIDSKYLGICYDSGNFAFTDENPLEAISAFSDRILGTHLKDVCNASEYPDAIPFDTVRDPIHFCALGEGYLPIGTIIEELSKFNINRFTLEICSPHIKSIPEKELLAFESSNVEKSIDYIKKILSK